MISITLHLIIYGIVTSICTLRDGFCISSTVKRVLNCSCCRATSSYQILSCTIINKIGLASRWRQAAVRGGYRKCLTATNCIVTTFNISNCNCSRTYIGVVSITYCVLRCWYGCSTIHYGYSRLLGCTIVGIACLAQSDCRILNCLCCNGYLEVLGCNITVISITFHLIIYSIASSISTLRDRCSISCSIKRIMYSSSGRTTSSYQILSSAIIHKVTFTCWWRQTSISRRYSKRRAAANDIVTTIHISNSNCSSTNVGVISVTYRVFCCRNSSFTIFYRNRRLFSITIISITCLA